MEILEGRGRLGIPRNEYEDRIKKEYVIEKSMDM